MSQQPEFLPEVLDILRGAAERRGKQKPNGAAAAPPEMELPPLRIAADLYQSHAGEIRELIPGLLCDGLTLFAARQKSGKSWLALQLAIAVAGGRGIGGLAVRESGPVLYAALEEPAARTGGRLRKLAPPGDWLHQIAFVYHLMPLMGGGAEQLEALIEDTAPRLLVLDTFSALAKSGSKDSDVFRSQYREVTRLREISEKARIAMLLIHHTRKGVSDNAVEAVAGTGGITAGCDAIWVMKRQTAGEAIIEITGREIEERSLAMQFDGGVPFGWRFIGDGAEVALTEERKQVLDLIREEGGQSPLDVSRELGKPRGAVRMLLKRMADDGLVRKLGKKYEIPTYSVSDRSDK